MRSRTRRRQGPTRALGCARTRARGALAAAWLAFAPAATGCGGPPEAPAVAEGPTPVGPSPTAISPAPAADDTLIVAVRRLPAGLDPLAELDPWGQRVADDLLYEGLVRRTAEAAPWAEPALAERCEQDPAARGIACLLRADAEFHDGSPVTREDALYSLGLWTGPRGQALRQRYGLDGLRAVEAIEGPPGGPKDSSGRWLRLSFEHDDPLALEKIAAMKIVPRARHQASGFEEGPIGSGPFRVLAQDDVQVTFERVAPAPGLARRIALRAIDDGAAALTALRRGEVHVLAEVAPIHVPKELAKPAMASRFVAYLVSPPRYDLVLFNLRDGVQAGPRMRQALDLATPRAELAQQVYGLRGLPIAAPIDLHAPAPIDLAALAEGRDAEAGLGPLVGPIDLAADASGRTAADAILNELGWIHERGVRRRQNAVLRLPLTWDPSPGLATGVARALRAGWKQIGIQAPSVTASWAYVVTNLLRAGKFSVALVRLAGSSDHDLGPWFHSKGAHNLVGLADGILDAALDAYRLATTREQRDAAKKAIAERLATLRPVIVLHAPVGVTLFSRAVTGIAFADDLPRLDRLGFEGGQAGDAWARRP